MEKIKFITDSASDIPDGDLARYDITMLHIPIAIDGAEYYERKSFSIEQFYRILAESGEIPVTSRIPAHEYLECFRHAYEAGEYVGLICVTINAGGSGTYDSALFARKTFYEKFPGAEGAFPIHVVDSGTYAFAYGHAVVQGARMAEEGKPMHDILLYLDDWFASVEIYLGLYSLEYARKSGRITAASAVVGDVLGIRPIISMIDGKTKTVEKARGDKLMPKRILELFRKNRADEDSEVVIVRGSQEEPALELKKLLDKETGRDIPIYYAGASIVINSGSKMLAVFLRGRKR